MLKRTTPGGLEECRLRCPDPGYAAIENGFHICISISPDVMLSPQGINLMAVPFRDNAKYKLH